MVTQLGSLTGRPQLAAALQPGSGICFSPSWTPPRARSATLRAGITSPPLASPLLQPARRKGEIPPMFSCMAFIQVVSSHPRRVPQQPRAGRTCFWDAPRLRSPRTRHPAGSIAHSDGLDKLAESNYVPWIGVRRVCARMCVPCWLAKSSEGC